jgi:hypothetical protein
MSRAASSFVTSFRALAGEAPDSANRSLREQEAQRCRGAWCAACGELEQVEASLMVLHGIELASLDSSANPATDMAAIREAVEGDGAKLNSFMARLHGADPTILRQAEVWVRSKENGAPPLRGFVSSLTEALDALTTRLGRRP